MYNIAISDLDGTLLGPDHMISDKTKESIINWVDADKKFVIATGRHYLDVKKYQEFIGIPLYLITSNGDVFMIRMETSYLLKIYNLI